MGFIFVKTGDDVRNLETTSDSGTGRGLVLEKSGVWGSWGWGDENEERSYNSGNCADRFLGQSFFSGRSSLK